MNILIVGVSGFIGRHLYHALIQDGHSIKGCSRNAVADINWQRFNFGQKQDDWEALLKHIDLVINAAGIYQQSAQHRFSQIHDTGPKVLFDACSKLRIKVLQISAIGAEQDKPVSEFLQSKRNADQYLLAKENSSVVIYPGIVLGEQGKSTRQLSLLARLFCIPLAFGRQKELPLISIYQLCDYIRQIINHWPAESQSVALVAKPETMEQLLNNLRHWMGLRKGYFFAIPKQLINLGFYFFPKLSIGVFNKQSMAMLSAYSNKKRRKDSKVVTLENETASESLLKQSLVKYSATKRFKKEIKIKGLFYINLLVLGIIWIASGLVSLFNLEQSRELISLIGIQGNLGDVVIAIAALADILLGLFLWVSLWFPRLRPWVIYSQIGVMIIYSIILTFFVPMYWLHPFAPIIKNLAMLILALYLLVEEEVLNQKRNTHYV